MSLFCTLSQLRAFHTRNMHVHAHCDLRRPSFRKRALELAWKPGFGVPDGSRQRCSPLQRITGQRRPPQASISRRSCLPQAGHKYSTVQYCTAHKQPLHGPRSPDLGRFRPQGALCRYREPIPADKACVYLLCFFQRFQGCDRAWRPTHRAHATGICASPRAVGGRCCAVVLV